MIGSRSIAVVMLASLLGGISPAAFADSPTGSSVKEAGKHFQRGVALYSEADYRAALVEFRRAYEIAPNPAVLYNIGQTYYQLQNYAAALSTLERYLAESGPTAPHRQEVEQTIATLQARVGKVAITTNVPDCEITIDDELVGKTPLSEPVLVSIGRRKITAIREGLPPETRFVDVAAGDTVALALSLGSATGAAPMPAVGPAVPRSDGSGLVTAGWVTTGLFGAGAIATGVYAFVESRRLENLRDSFPASRNDLTRTASRVSTFSTVSDVLWLATLVAGGVTLKLALSRSSAHEAHVMLAPNGVQIAGTFR